MNLTLALRLVAAFALLCASAIVAQNSKPPAQKSLPKDYSFTIDANQIWTDTGLDLHKGDRVHVFGTVNACEGPSPSEKAHLLLPSAPGGAVLVKLHLEATPIPAVPMPTCPSLVPAISTSA